MIASKVETNWDSVGHEKSNDGTIEAEDDTDVYFKESDSKGKN